MLEKGYTYPSYETILVNIYIYMSMNIYIYILNIPNIPGFVRALNGY